MRRLRATAAAVVLLILNAAAVSGQCVSSVDIISERGTTPRFLAGPSAWNGSMLLVAGPELDREEFQLRLYDQFGHPLYPSEKIRSSGENLIDVLWTGTEFGVFHETSEEILALTRVNTVGKALDPRVIEIDDIELLGDDQADVAWSSQDNEYIVAHTLTSGGQRDIIVSWVQRDGSVAKQTTIDDASLDSFVRVAIAASGTIGIFYEDEKANEVYYVAINGDVKRKPVRVWDSGDDVLVAARGNEFALLRRVDAGSDSIVRWQIIDTSAQIIRRDSRIFLGTGGDVEPVALLAIPGEYALSYLEWTEGLGNGDAYYRLARFGLDEERISDTYFSAATGNRRRRERTDFPFEWTGSAYVSLVSNENGDDQDTYFVRYCPLRATVSAPRFARAGQVVTFTASADGGVPGYAYTWTWGDFGTAQGPTMQLSFPSNGEQHVTLTVRDSTGTVTTAEFHIAIGDPRHRAVRK
ncbi:MAG TPA: PKD domain-containing protein [Thermoanaerobaculia bacterium]|nr:PKD domain-containing protein [Thermoanaerobaculia bacterium]